MSGFIEPLHYITLDAMGKSAAAQAVIDEHLLWLLEDGLKLTSGNQRKIRDMLRRTVKS